MPEKVAKNLNPFTNNYQKTLVGEYMANNKVVAVDEFKDARTQYLTDLVENEGVSARAKKLIIAKVNELEDRDYKVIGYGSLLNSSDVYRTSPNLVRHEVGFLDGWTRIFNMGSANTGSYLNVRPSNRKSMIVAILTVPALDMFSLIEREINYRMLTVKVRDEVGKTMDALMVVGYKAHTTYNLIPQANYLHLCMNGAGKLGGKRGIDNFIDSTETCFGTLKEFLQTPLEQVYRAQVYSSR
jgi:hypothetical protein